MPLVSHATCGSGLHIVCWSWKEPAKCNLNLGRGSSQAASALESPGLSREHELPASTAEPRTQDSTIALYAALQPVGVGGHTLLGTERLGLVGFLVALESINQYI